MKSDFTISNDSNEEILFEQNVRVFEYSNLSMEDIFLLGLESTLVEEIENVLFPN